ncbi:DUF6090 family protein [Balneola sp. MJW-20]|uniref:DUF6090 family protein n=1 Tax=Gracilimonas aurantiaca TaxID=3234185 RepID=UPI0034651440
MITLFRRIREKLIASGSVTKYLLYAVGEILLVVVGILIALQVNNWNEEKTRQKQEQVILDEIISDLKESEATIAKELIPDMNSSNVAQCIKSISILNDHMQQGLPYADSLDMHFTSIFSYSDLAYKVSGYEMLKSYGFDYIRDPELRKSIGIYYTTIVPRTRNDFDDVRDDFYSYMLDYLRKEFNTVFIEKYGDRNLYIPIRYEDLMQDSEFIQTLNVYRDIQEQYLYSLKSTLKETRDLLALIDRKR